MNYLILVQGSRPAVPLRPDGSTGVPVGVVLEEGLGLGVAASLHRRARVVELHVHLLMYALSSPSSC